MRSLVSPSIVSLGVLAATARGEAQLDNVTKRPMLSTRGVTRVRAVQESDLPSKSKQIKGSSGVLSNEVRGGSSHASGESGSKSGTGGSSLGTKRGGPGSKTGSKGKGKGGSKGASKGSDSGCSETVFYFTDNEFKGAYDGNGLIATNDQVPIYNEAGQKIGTYSESTVVFGERNCMSNGVYSLDFKNGEPSSQIFTSQTCCGVDMQSITGGTGQFQCSSGFVEQLKVDSSPHRNYRRVVICEAAGGQCIN